MLVVRKSVNSLTDLEMREYISGVKILKGKQLPEGADRESGATNVYDWYTKVHEKLAKLYHGTALFLPWHRAFILQFERDMRGVLGNPLFALPYWDWEADAALADPVRDSNVWRDTFMGGSGNPITGPFANWKLAPPQETNGIKRDFGFFEKNLPNKQDIKDVMDGTTLYDARPWNTPAGKWGILFRLNLEFHHNRVHMWIGGSMRDMATSPNDPVFWLHHCNVDRLWWWWQNAKSTQGFLARDRQYLPQEGSGTVYDADKLMVPWDNNWVTTTSPYGRAPKDVNDILLAVDRHRLRLDLLLT